MISREVLLSLEAHEGPSKSCGLQGVLDWLKAFSATGSLGFCHKAGNIGHNPLS